MDYKKVLFFPAFLLGLLVLGFYVNQRLFFIFSPSLVNDNKNFDGKFEVQKIIDKCVTTVDPGSRKTCYETEILQLSDQHATETGTILHGIWEAALKDQILDDPRMFSDTAHDAGMLMVSKNFPLEQAFEYCGKDFKQGCTHGYIMELIDTNYPGISSSTNPAWFSTCNIFTDKVFKNNCIHGLGHELFAKFPEPLPEVLKKCQLIAHSTEEQHACESGVLMEFSKGSSSDGNHSHYATGSVDLPCNSLPIEYKGICYGSEGSYKQYYPDQQPLTQTFAFCSGAPKNYRMNCMLGASERVIMGFSEKAEKAYVVCDSMPEKENAKLCFESMIQVSETQFENPKLTGDLENYYFRYIKTNADT